jgi:hypothetical protein
VSTGVQVWVSEGATGRDCAVRWWSSRSGRGDEEEVPRGCAGRQGGRVEGEAEGEVGAVRRAAWLAGRAGGFRLTGENGGV